MHLPHLLAFGLVDSLAKRHENLEIFRYAAGGFRDFTRIAGSHPEMWRDICVANRVALLEELDAYLAERGDLVPADEVAWLRSLAATSLGLWAHERAADGTPYSSEFRDLYHSVHGAVAQSRHVFLGGNALPGLSVQQTGVIAPA